LASPRAKGPFERDLAQTLLSTKASLRLFLVAMVVGLVTTRSRMGNSAFFTSLLIAGGVALVFSRHATRSTVVLIASLIVVDIFIIGAWFGVEKTMQRIEQTTVRDVESRGDPGNNAIELARDFPLTGAGPGSFYTAFMRYPGPEIRSYHDFAENDYIQFLAETGLVGVLLVRSLPVMALARGMAFAALMGVCAIAMHSSVDFNLQIPANAFAFMILLSFAWVAFYLKAKE
jgi:O-antigen ligase